VDLFFVLSGFLIGGILLQNKKSSKYFSTFYMRRAARILPLYIIILGALVIIITLRPGSLEESIKWHLPMWSYLTFTQNFQYAARQAFSDPWIDVTWSLAVEEQFYIFLSLLIWRSNKKTLSLITIVLIILAPALRYISTSMAGYVLPLHRADSLMLGVLLTIVWQTEQGKEFLFKHARLFQWSLLLFVPGVLYLVYRSIYIGDAFGHFLLALLYGNVVLLALLHNENKARLNIYNSKILEWFGLRSYGIYLFHKPIQILTPLLLAKFLDVIFSQWSILLITTIVLIVASEVSYRAFEKPIMSLGHYFKYE